MACECNLVWNYINDLSYTHTQRTGKFFTAYEMSKYTSGRTRRSGTGQRLIEGIGGGNPGPAARECYQQRRQFRKSANRDQANRARWVLMDG